MKDVSRVGIDISRSVFQLHGVDKEGKVVLRKRLYRSEIKEVMQQLPECEIGIEACSGSHYWGREFRAMGHTVRLIPPQYVKPYVKRNKNDAADAEAIAEAMSRPTMRFTEVKSVSQQELGQLHRARAMMVKHRTALINEIKGFLHEYGIVLSSSHLKLRQRYLEVLEKRGDSLGEITKRLMERLFEQLATLSEEIKKHESELEALHEQNEASKRLVSIPGVGVMTATAVVAAVGNVDHFRNGREFAASLGLVPRQHSSGQRERLGGISKRGDGYLRKLLVQGGHSVVTNVNRGGEKNKEWLRSVLERRGRCKAVVAAANKNARIIWALLKRGGTYDPHHKSVKPILQAAA